MNENNYIITVYDIIKYTTIYEDVSPNSLCLHLDCELDALEECFGADVYADMLAELNIPADAVEWCAGIEYQVGQHVQYNGAYFIRVQCDNYDQLDDDSPNCSDCWQPVAKFKNDCYNKIWGILMKYLVWSVYVEAYPFLEIHDDKDAAAGYHQIKLRTIRGKCASYLDKLKKKIKSICDAGECSIFLNMAFMGGCKDDCGVDEHCPTGIAWKHSGR